MEPYPTGRCVASTPRRIASVCANIARTKRQVTWAARGRLREAAFRWARVAAQRDLVSQRRYQALRARGHGPARALRSVADRLLNVARAMLRDGACFDPQRVRISTT